MTHTSQSNPSVSAKHTPGPWTFDDSNDHRSHGYIRAAKGEKAVGVDAPAVKGPAVARVTNIFSYSENRANAAFIVQACNSHEQLVEALRTLISYNRDILAGKINYRPQDHIDVAEAALQKAGVR